MLPRDGMQPDGLDEPRCRRHRFQGVPALCRRRHALAEIGEGLKLVLHHPLLRPLAGCGATFQFFGWAFLAVYVLYMTQDLGLGPGAVGSVFALGGIGALIGALIAEPLGRRFGVGPTIVWARLACGLGGLVVPIAVVAPDVALPMVLFAEWFQWLAEQLARDAAQKEGNPAYARYADWRPRE